MAWRVSLSLCLLAACGADDMPSDAGADVSASDAAPSDSESPDADVGPPGTGDRLGLFGPAPSFFERFEGGAALTPRDTFHFGGARSGFTWPIPIAGDFDGDGFDEVGVYDPRAGRFHLRAGDGAERRIDVPTSSGFPVVGDWDGDGRDGLGVYDPTTGAALLFDEEGLPTRTDEGPPERFAFAADLDGDGLDALVYYDGASFEAGASPVSLDAPASGYPFAVDVDGDGLDGIGVFTLDDQTFHLFSRLDTRARPEVVAASRANWIRYPLAGRWGTPVDAGSGGFPYETVAPRTVAIDAAALAGADDALDGMPNLRSLLVMKGGALAHEAYFHGNHAEVAHNIKSVSKSVLGVVLALAADDGTVRDLPLYQLLPELDDGDPMRRRITLAHLLTMTAGLAWSEDAIGDWIVLEDWTAGAFATEMWFEPGTAFNYSTGNTHLASVIITRESGVDTDELARERLLTPLGIVAERWDRAPDGTPVGGAEVTMRPRDLARFGQLFLEDGAPDGVRVVDSAIVDRLRTERIAPAAIDGDLGYGGWWWTRTFATTDAYFAWGYGGQFVFVFPTLDAVVVITSRSDVDGATSTTVSYDVFSVVSDHIVPALGGI